MQGLTIGTVAEACGGTVYGADTDEEKQNFTGVVIDSRKIGRGNLFIATKGERVDGHNYIPQAFEKGCLAAVCEHLPEILPGPCILVKDSFTALKKIAAYYRSVLDIRVVGITGSVGKTSTKEVVASVLSEKYRVLKTEGNFNNEVGLPLTVLSIREQHQVAVLEMGMNHFGEMRRLSEIARPDVCVITNIGPCHLEFLGDLDGVLKAKTEIFEYMNPEGICCLNGDDERLRRIHEVHGKKPLFFGNRSDCDVTVSNVEDCGLYGSRGILHIGKEEMPFRIAVPGKHMIQNALCAATVGKWFGLTIEQIAAGIGKTRPVAGRSRIVDTGKLLVIDDCYNANPVSMKSAIHLLETAKTRKVAILGDMFELGEDEIQLHEEVGQFLAGRDIDVVICIGKLAEHIYIQAGKQIENCYYFSSKEEFQKEIGNLIQTADTVLIKASNGMKFSTIVNLCLQGTWL